MDEQELTRQSGQGCGVKSGFLVREHHEQRPEARERVTHPQGQFIGETDVDSRAQETRCFIRSSWKAFLALVYK